MDSKVPLPRVNVRDQLGLRVFWLSLKAQSAALFPIVNPLQILLFLPPGQIGNVQQAVLLGWISTVGAIVSLVMPPLFGMASDRSTSRFGRRRPYIFAGTLLLILGSFLLAAAGHVLILLLSIIVLHFHHNP